jgi:asparagine synthase (glutamine-hydrolysing)
VAFGSVDPRKGEVMCGIAGYLKPVEGDEGRLLERMCDAMHHRGPDDAGYYRDEDVALGMRRLSIIDLATGAQPMYNEDRSIVVVMNGEIYNYVELKAQYLSGHRFSSASDTEVLVHLYEEKGAQMVHLLNGMFAFALWDMRRKRLIIARDRIGIKPLYYFRDAHSFVFASEIRPILLHGISPDLDMNAIRDYLSLMYIPGPRTPLKSVRKLQPGTMAVLEDGKFALEKYWDVELGTLRDRTEDEIIEGFDDLFTDSVRLQLRSDVPVGIFLSGGIDSGAVASKIVEMSGHDVNTFSVGFDGSLVNELPYARRVASLLGTNHHELVLSGKQLWENLPTLMESMEEPLGDSAMLPTYLLSRYASQYVKVVLNGTGGDELFGGYEKYLSHYDRYKLLRLLRFLPGGFLQRLSESVSRAPRISRKLRMLATPLDFFSDRSFVFRPEEIQRLMAEAYRDGSGQSSKFEPFVTDRLTWLSGDIKNLFMAADIKTYLVDDLLLLLDKMTMAHSLEARVPFLDHRVVEYAMTIPSSSKMRNGVTKYLLKRWLQRKLPRDILERPKQGFGAPISRWYEDELQEKSQAILLDPGAHCHQYLAKEPLEKNLQGMSTDPRSAQKIFSLVCLEVWCKRYLKN